VIRDPLRGGVSLSEGPGEPAGVVRGERVVPWAGKADGCGVPLPTGGDGCFFQASAVAVWLNRGVGAAGSQGVGGGNVRSIANTRA